MLRTIRRVCVFCGSNFGTDPAYRHAAEEIGRELARRGWGLVYGGGSVGLMGATADAVLSEEGEVVGVIPKMLATRELLHTGVADMRVTATMHTRKALMEQSADAFVALPGGFGTFEELLEMITWGQLGLHEKPIGLLNTQGFYDGLVTFFDRAIDQGFIKPRHRELFVVSRSPSELLDRLTTHAMPQVKKWISPAEG